MAKPKWTAEKVEEFKKLWAEGLSASVIGVRLGGFTKNAVIGKRLRLGLPERDKSMRYVYRRRSRSVGSPKKPKASAKDLSVVSQQSVECAAPTKAVSSSSLYVPSEERTAVMGALETNLPPTTATGCAAIAGSRLGACRWPIGDPNDSTFRFCEREVESEGDVYCSGHTALAKKC